jgi:hypothetical protein
MPRERLAIPLSANPARQKLWRAVSFLSVVGLAVGLGATLNHALNFPSTRGQWPSEATAAVSIPKTTRTLAHTEAYLSDIQTLPNYPLSLHQALAQSKKGITLYLNGQETVGVKLHGRTTENPFKDLSAWDLRTETQGQRYLILPKNAQSPQVIKKAFQLWAFLPGFDGAIVLQTPDHAFHSAPFRITEERALDIRINMEAFIPQNEPTLNPDTNILVFSRLNADLSQGLITHGLPGNVPGLQKLAELAQNQGFELTLGQDQTGLAYVFATGTHHLSLEDLGAIAQEGLSLQSLSTIGLTNEIRSTAKIGVDVDSENGIQSATARGENGDLVRLNATASQLIVSNRPAKIGLESAQISTSCLKNPAGFIKPLSLLELLPTPYLSGHDLGSKLRTTQEIAYTKNWLRICW